jgi:NAD+ synthase
MPIGKMREHLKDAELVINNIGIESKIIQLENAFKAMSTIDDFKNSLTIANIKPRLRMTSLYAFAQENNYLVLGTDNAAE